MWRVLEDQEASQSKSLRGLDNTAADGADGFKHSLRIVDEIERAGALKDWCEQARKRLHEGKLYLKTTYHDYCREDGSCCPDHCRAFALSDVTLTIKTHVAIVTTWRVVTVRVSKVLWKK